MIVCSCTVLASRHLTDMLSLADAGAATAAMSEPQTSESEGEEATKAVGTHHTSVQLHSTTVPLAFRCWEVHKLPTCALQ
jgi:phage gp29-like protein